MTDTRDPQTEKGQNGATEENLAETAQAPEKTLEEQFREEICPTCTTLPGKWASPSTPMSMMPFPMKSGMTWNPAWSAPCTSAATA